MQEFRLPEVLDRLLLQDLFDLPRRSLRHLVADDLLMVVHVDEFPIIWCEQQVPSVV